MPENEPCNNDGCPFALGEIVHPKGKPEKAGELIGDCQFFGGHMRCRVKHFDGKSQVWDRSRLMNIQRSVGQQSGFDSYAGPKDLLLNITYHKLRGKLADVIYSMEATQTDFYAHQYKPVLKLLESPCEGILLADEVGLGKTIQAGLIWTEIRARFQAKRLLVICPAVLREKWRYELRSKFGVNASVVKADEVHRGLKEAASDPSYSFHIIASYDGLRPPKGWEAEDTGGMQNRRELAQFLLARDETDAPLIDLLVADEAHKARNPASQTYTILNLLTSCSTFKALLSATPIQLNSDNLFRLLNLLDPNAFDSQFVFQKILEANRPLVQASDRLNQPDVTRDDIKELLNSATVNQLLESNQTLQEAIIICEQDDAPLDERERVLLKEKITQANLLNHVISRSRKREVLPNRVLRNTVAFGVDLTETEHQFYDKVTEIVRDYANSRGVPGGFLTVTPQMQVSSSIVASLNYWQDNDSDSGEIYEEDMMYEEDGINTDEERPMLNYIRERLSNYQLEELENHDSKFILLSENLQPYLNNNPKAKVVIFAYFRSTLRYLERKLAAQNIKTELLMGGLPEPKEAIIERFKSSKGANIMLSSEVGSEGIDLQFAEVVINYDLPWNPMRVEQRIGRLDRIGQKADQILIWNFFAKNTIDEKIYTMLYVRLNLIENTIGGMEHILGERMESLKRSLFSTRLTPEQEEERIHQTALAIEEDRTQTEQLENEAADLVAHGDYITNQIHAAKNFNLWLDAGDIENFIRQFFEKCFPNSRIVPSSDYQDRYEISLCANAHSQYEEFCREEKIPQTKLDNCVFGTKVVDEEFGKSTIINQFHAITRFAAATTGSYQGIKLDKFKVRVDSRFMSMSPRQYAFFISKWAVSGIRDYEKFDYRLKAIGVDEVISGGEAEQQIGLALTHGRSWIKPEADGLNAELAQKETQCCRESRGEAWVEWAKSIRHRNHDRVELQKSSLQTRIERKLKKLEEALVRAKLGNNQSVVLRFETQIRNTKVDLEKTLSKLEAIQQRAKEAHDEITEICWGILQVDDA